MKTNDCTRVTKPAHDWGRQGMALGMVMVVVVVVSILGAALMSASNMNSVETSRYLNSVKAFWLADAGAQRFDKRAFDQNWAGFTDATVGAGTMQVVVYSNASPPYAECIGTVAGARQRVQVEFQYLAPSFNHSLFSGNVSSNSWYLTMRGNGGTNVVSGHWINGRDLVMGNVYVNGNVALYDQSVVSNAPAPNSYAVRGDVEATGSISTQNAARVAGFITPSSTNQPVPAIALMNYASNNTWNVAREFQSGSVASTHPLYNVIKKIANANTTGDDYYFEPRTPNNNNATQFQAKTPLDLGTRAIYYVDGNVWFNNTSTYGFSVTGTATIVATGDIHISDNLKYATTNDLLGLIALGSYNSSGQLTSGGNVYFGDPDYGTMYTVDAFMLAANNFLYNTSANNPAVQMEPTTGFEVYGNYAALNQIQVYRDWLQNYSTNNSTHAITTNARAAFFNPGTGKWYDVANTNMLGSETNTPAFRHYQMTVRYDERIRRQSTQPPRLPGLQSGASGYYGGITRWRLVPL